MTADHVASNAAPRSGSEGLPPSTRRGGSRTDVATALIVTGTCCVLLGGVTAAFTGPLGLAHGSWLAAYLVLVGGVAQYAMGEARARHPGRTQRLAWGRVQISGWNLGNALVIGGTLLGDTRLVDGGSVFLVVALVVAGHASWRRDRSAGPGQSSTLFDVLYRVLLIVMVTSIPIGIVLSHLRHP